jgi:hypothetical protein
MASDPVGQSDHLEAGKKAQRDVHSTSRVVPWGKAAKAWGEAAESRVVPWGKAAYYN